MADSAAATIWEGVFEATLLLLLLPQPAAMTAIVAAAVATLTPLVCSDMGPSLWRRRPVPAQDDHRRRWQSTPSLGTEMGAAWACPTAGTLGRMPRSRPHSVARLAVIVAGARP